MLNFCSFHVGHVSTLSFRPRKNSAAKSERLFLVAKVGIEPTHHCWIDRCSPLSFFACKPYQWLPKRVKNRLCRISRVGCFSRLYQLGYSPSCGGGTGIRTQNLGYPLACKPSQYPADKYELATKSKMLFSPFGGCRIRTGYPLFGHRSSIQVS